MTLQDMPISHSNRCSEPLMHAVKRKELSAALSNATVNLSVSCLFSAGTRRAFPLSRDRLLTIEWE